MTPTRGAQSRPWTIAKSADVYQINGWGSPYFGINDRGHICVHPSPGRDRAVDLHALTCDLKARGLELPLLIRFPDILADRIRHLNVCFAKAIDEYEYAGRYQGVYPIKVNQQRHLVDEIVEFGQPWHLGLEVGSKPELLIALATVQHSGGLVICNGYKDKTYIETALLATQFDKTVIVVLERLAELDVVFAASEKLGITPVLGVRARLSERSQGHWAGTTGDQAKFGLSAAEIVEIVDRLGARGELDSLRLLHFHLGSQISSIIPIKNAMREAAQYYVEMAKMGCAMRYLDVGGGLGVDYDGSKTDSNDSANYDVQAYAYDVVAAAQQACARAGIEPPTLVSESGRAMVAYSSLLVFEVVGVSDPDLGPPSPPGPDSHQVLHDLHEAWLSVDALDESLQEAWHDASQARDEAHSLFKLGYLSLRETLGDLHNLFGDTNTVHVQLTHDGYRVVHVVTGDTIKEVLGYVAYDPEALVERVRQQAERALRAGRITFDQMQLVMRHYATSLGGYTYLTDV